MLCQVPCLTSRSVPGFRKSPCSQLLHYAQPVRFLQVFHQMVLQQSWQTNILRIASSVRRTDQEANTEQHFAGFSRATSSQQPVTLNKLSLSLSSLLFSLLMDDTLTILSIETTRMVTKLNRKSLRALEKSGHHHVPGRKQEVSGVVDSGRLCVMC